MKRNACLALALACLAAPPAQAYKNKKPVPEPLVQAHAYPTGAFTFRTPAGWKDVALTGNPDAIQVTDGTSIVRFVYHAQEAGYDSLHAACMLERLAGPMETSPAVSYEYDFVSWMVQDRRVLDSAFVVTYDQPVLGSAAWRQRNLTLVGGGESLCVITYVPMKAWKGSAVLRATIEEVVKSVTFKASPPPAPETVHP